MSLAFRERPTDLLDETVGFLDGVIQIEYNDVY